MIYESLITPSEYPVSELEVKRAILTYDKVKLIDPSDRDIMPSNTFMMSIIGIPIMGIDTGPVRPMGKQSGYDDRFDELIKLLKPAINQGLVEVISTYNQEETKSATIGAVLTGGYPLNPQLVYWIYRNMAQNQDLLHAAIEHDKHLLIKKFGVEHNLALQGGGDGSINDIPVLPNIDDDKLPSEMTEYITKIARSRLGAFIKYAGFCEQKNLVPLFSSEVYGPISSLILNNTRDVLSGTDEDIFWTKRNRVLELCHEEYIDNDFLNSLSISDVIKLRTNLWGKQANARENLFASIAKLSANISSDPEFYTEAKKTITEYRNIASELELERKNVKFKIKCDIGIGVLGSITGLAGLLSQLQSPLSSIGLTLVAGGIWALEKSKEYIPVLREIRKQEEDIKRGAGLGIQNFYSRIK